MSCQRRCCGEKKASTEQEYAHVIIQKPESVGGCCGGKEASTGKDSAQLSQKNSEAVGGCCEERKTSTGKDFAPLFQKNPVSMGGCCGKKKASTEDDHAHGIQKKLESVASKGGCCGQQKANTEKDHAHIIQKNPDSMGKCCGEKKASTEGDSVQLTQKNPKTVGGCCGEMKASTEEGSTQLIEKDPESVPIVERQPFQSPSLIITTSRFRIENLCCEMEVGLVYSLLKPLQGIVDVKASSVGRTVVVRHRSPQTARSILDVLNHAHLGASVQDTAITVHDSQSGGESQCHSYKKCLEKEWKRGLPWTLLMLGVVGLCVTLYLRKSEHKMLRWAISAPFLVVCGAPLTLRALQRLLRRHIDVNLLMLMAIVGALVMGDITEALAVLILVMLGDRVRIWCLDYVGRLLEESTGRPVPQMATLVNGMVMPVEAVEVGTTVLVKAGESIPVDGLVVQGNAAVDESLITGEACPVEKTVDTTVLGGSICQNGMLEVRCTSVASDSSLARIKDLVQEVALSRSPTQEIVDRFAQMYMPVVILVALGTFLWRVFSSPRGTFSWRSGLYQAMEVLVLGCPCALVMAAPLPILTALAASVHRGKVLFKSAAALEALGRVRLLACDKTGTLTEGSMRVTDKIVFKRARLDVQLVSKLAASVESLSSHPLAAALVMDGLGCITTSYNKVGAQGGLSKVHDFKIVEGLGVSASCLEGRMVYKVVVGNEGVLENDDMNGDEGLQEFLRQHSGEAKIYVVVNGVPELVYSVADVMRTSLKETIQAIHALKVKTALLTGDSEEATARICSQAGISLVQTRMKPSDKLSWIRAQQDQNEHDSSGCMRRRRKGVVVAMVGDGINDGPSLMAADVGISMGARGTALAVAASDVVLMSDFLGRLPEAIRLSRAVNRVVIENIVLAVGIKLVVLGLIYGGESRLWMAVGSDALSLAAVVLNGLRPLCISKFIYKMVPSE